MDPGSRTETDAHRRILGRAKRLFPPAEAALIADLVARDADYYSPAISPETVRALNDFACSARLLTGPVSYEQVVAAEFVPLWETARGVAGR